MIQNKTNCKEEQTACNDETTQASLIDLIVYMLSIYDKKYPIIMLQFTSINRDLYPSFSNDKVRTISR